MDGDLTEQFTSILSTVPGLRRMVVALVDVDDQPPDRKSHEEADKANPHTKEEVDYGLPDDSDGPNRCGNCIHYSNRSCEIVRGPIDPAYVCDEYSPGQQARDPDAYFGPGSHRSNNLPDVH